MPVADHVTSDRVGGTQFARLHVMPRSIRILVLALAACGGASQQTKPGTRGMHADEHLDEADDHTARADRMSRWPDRPVEQPAGYDTTGTAGWYRAWDTVPNQLKLAREHRTTAAQLYAEYTEACGERPHAEVSVSPLQRYGVGGAPTAGGVRVFLDPEAGAPDHLLAAMRCHRAWMMLGRSDMESCPLDLAGIRIEARGDAGGITIDITVNDTSLVPELQRRAAHDLETAHHHNAPK